MTPKTKKSKKIQVPFDYRIIKSFEDACKNENADPSLLPVVSLLSEEHRKSIIAYYKLIIIFKAINNGWTPDYSKGNQYKYYPYFWVLSSGFAFDVTDYLCTDASTTCGSRLCTDTSEKSLYIAKQFEDLYRDYLLYLK